MPRKNELTVEGTVIQVLPHTMFRVTLVNGHTVLSHLSGKMRTHSIRLTIGDRVDLVLSMPDLTKGRIIYRHRR